VLVAAPLTRRLVQRLVGTEGQLTREARFGVAHRDGAQAANRIARRVALPQNGGAGAPR
jgi:hypothetical protein